MREEAEFREGPVSFVRRGGRMSEAQERAWDELSERYVVAVARGAASTSVAPGAVIDPVQVWGRSAPLIVEIGTGQGHAIVSAALAREDHDFLGVEVFRSGLARTMLDAEREGARNVRLAEANAPEVLAHLLAEASVTELWIFFPDPWHKNKHTKRRLVTAEFAALAGAALESAAMVRLATDWPDYARQMRTVMDADPHLERDFDGQWAPRFDGRVLTAYETKALRAERVIYDLAYVRRAR